MKKPFEWYHNLYYGEKKSLSDFDTKNPCSLDCLLKQMFMKAHDEGKLKMKNSLPALNAAYYVAVCLMNTEGIGESIELELDDEIDLAIKTIWGESYNRHSSPLSHVICPWGERMLIRWMSFAILFLQEKHSHEMNVFLKMYKVRLSLIEYDDGLIKLDDWGKYRYLFDLPGMIEQWKYRYTTDFRPHPMHPSCYDDDIWDNYVREYNYDELECQLTLFRTKGEQMAFLNWALVQSCRPLRYGFLPDNLSIPEDKYNDLSKRIVVGEFLKDNTPVADGLPSLPAKANVKRKFVFEGSVSMQSFFQKDLNATSKKMESAQAKELAEKMFGEGVKFASNIKKVKSGEEANVCMSMLGIMIDASKGLLDKDTRVLIKDEIYGILNKRNAAMEALEEAPRNIEYHFHDEAKNFEKIDNYNPRWRTEK